MFSRDVLTLDIANAARTIEAAIREQVAAWARRGVVLGVSGGVDSAVVLALCVRALGAERVAPLLMPEQDASPDAERLGRHVVERFGATPIVEDITATLEAAGCYQRQAEAIRQVIPDFDRDWRSKITLPSILEGERLNVSLLTAESPAGHSVTVRLTASAYRQLIAATNFKQRVRKMMEYYHADRLGYCVVGTPNRLEYDQGFFVKHGDGSADLKPIAHLYKTQVYAMAEYLDVPEEIRRRPATTDTFSLAQTQEEFYFSVPHDVMDLCLYGHTHGVAVENVAAVVGLTTDQVERIYRDIELKRRATRYLHAPPALVSPIAEIAG